MKKLTRREFIKFASTGIAAVAAGRCAAPLLAADQSKPRLPNVLFVFADQLRACSLGCYGDTYVRTPNIDRLASQGMLLENAFSASPVCTPYRAQMLTGKFGCTTGVTHNDVKLPEKEVTVAERLKQAGYATGFIGKWHLEGGRSAEPGSARRKGFVPQGAARQGFDYWAALECSHNYYKTQYYRDSEEPVPIDGYEPDVQTDLAIEYMRQHKDRPFMLMLSWGPPHNPYKPPEKFNTYDGAKLPLRPNVPEQFHAEARKFIPQYCGLISSLDENVGRLMKALDDLHLAEDTIVVFTSDHGDMLYSQGQTLKQRPWEESSHIPFILRYSSKIKPAQKQDVLLNSVDVMPTLLGLCGQSVPSDVQGLNLAPVLLGQSDKKPESILLSIPVQGGNTPAVGAWLAVRTPQYLYAIHGKGEWLLYDLKADPYEMKNLINDPAAAEPKAKLKAMLDDWCKRTGEKILPGTASGGE